MRNLLIASTALATVSGAFANAKNKPAEGLPDPASLAPAAPAAPATGAGQDRVAPVISEVAFLPLPIKAKSARGGKSQYDFDKLDAPQRDESGNITAYASFAVLNKTAKQLRSVVSVANSKQLRDASNSDGSPKFKMNTLTDANGNKVPVPTTEREQEYAKYFQVFETDPATDPAGASARVFRTDTPPARG